MAGGMLTGVNRDGHDSSTTYSAISQSTLEIRNPERQVQDIDTLSRDVEHANNALSPIFDKEKEQQRLKQAQLIGEIGQQSMDIIRTQGDIVATRKAEEELASQGNSTPTPEQIRASAAYKVAMAEYGTGGPMQRAAQAVTAALQGLAGGDIGTAAAGAAAPYLANTIKRMTEGNEQARLMAHALLGAVVAQAQGNAAAAGAAGAVTGEVAAQLIAERLYGTRDTSTLGEEQKQTIAALSTLASGLAGAAVGGDAANAVAGAQAGNNAAENNAMGMAGGDLGFWLSKVDGCDSDCKAQIAGQTALGGLQASGALLAVAAGGVVTPELVAAARAGAAACSANPALCANEVGFWLNELALSEALPAGLAIGNGVKLTAAQYAEVRALMELEKQTGSKISAEAVGVALGQGTVGAKGVPSSTLTREELISGLPAGTKITPESVVDIRKLSDGRTVWLETGSDAAGLQHIYKRHEVDFANKGILRDEIPTVVMNALERGEVIGVNGSANVYRIIHNGIEQNIAIGIGSNGFVVRANPVSSWKTLP